MSGNPSYLEDRVSQLPAVRLLMALGWQYLPPQEAVSARNGKVGGVLLDTILTDWLSRRSFAHKGSRYSFSAANITAAVNALKDVPLNQGLTAASMAVYELLTLGKGVEQVIDGSRTSFNLDFIDWQHPANNVYHVTDEFTVERRGSYQTRRPDIVLFVNGIPLAVIECKRPDKEANRGEWGAYEGVSQMLRNQRLEDEIPHLFAYAQLLMAVDTNHALYATLATPKKFWAVWKEEGDIEPEVMRLINTRLTAAEKDRLYGWHSDAARLRREMDANDAQPRLPTGQDRAVYALLRPARLLDLAYGFVLYDNGRKKIARYQQYFAVKATVERVKDIGADGTRAGGVIWHTTGSGKSLTMVMLAKALALHPQVQNPRVVLVTDRIDLDDQIWKTFRACGKTVAQARSGKHLTDLIREPRHEIITTVIDKFETVANSDLRDANPNVFVLVDESHRSQYGRSQAKMRAVFQKGCYIGFTGTPLLKAEKSTATKFGGFIHKYTMRQAVDDGAVAPLLYEGRLVDMDVSRDQLDQWFERRTRKLNAEQIADLKRKMSRAEEVNRVKARLQLIAYDIAEHYKDNWRGTGFKAQLATSSKEVAILYRQMLQDEGIDCEVVISSPDTREGNDDVDDGELPLVQTFWKQMMGRYTDEERYLKGVKASFARDDGTEILIVVDKLLVGFDEPLNTVLYIDKHLQEHNLLQAIARVNRLYEGKEFGYIVDYRGVLGELNEAMQTYNALEGFDLEDVQGIVIPAGEIANELPQLHDQLLSFFNPVGNRRDQEALERFLEPEDRRREFYERLTKFINLLRVAQSRAEFAEPEWDARLQAYKADLKFFHSLRMSVKLRYAESIDYSEYEDKIRKLLDDHIQAKEVAVIVPEVNIFDERQFESAVAEFTGGSTEALADSIAYRLKKTATEKLEEDPAFYRKFSQMIEDTIEEYRQGRLSEIEYLNRMEGALDQIRTGRDSSLPPQLDGRKDAPAYYGLLVETFTHTAADALSADVLSQVADLAITFEESIRRLQIRDWMYNPIVRNQMCDKLEDALYDARDALGVPLTGGDMDTIVDNVLATAQRRYELSL